MRKDSFFIVLAGLFLTASAAEMPADFALKASEVMTSAKMVTTARFPDADRVLVENRVLERYEKDGTSITWDDDFTKVLTEKGRRDAQSVSVPFNLHYGTSFVYRAEIIKPNGTAVPIDVATYSRVMIDPGQMGANIYDPADKVLGLSMPGVEVGDVCHVTTCRIVSKARVPDTWGDYAIFEYDLPIVKIDYQISAPPELPIKHAVLRAAVTNTLHYAATQQKDGRTLHTWQVRNVPQMFPEPDMPPLYTQVQRVLLSTVGDWRDVSRWYWKLCEPALKKTTPQMEKKVQELIAGATTRDEKIRRIFKFVSQEIRYMGITTENVAPGYEPHDVSLTFENRYGVCRDKAALLASLLTLAGIPGYPVLIHAGAKMDPDVPLPYFNHAITAVDRPGGGYMLMDPTDENTRELLPSYLCNHSYLVAKSEGETLLVSDIYPAEKNLTRITSEGTLDESGALILHSKIAFDGINDNAYRGHFLRLKAEERRTFFESLLKNRLSGAEVLACTILPQDLQDTETPLTVELTGRVPNFPIRGQHLDSAALPWLGVSLGYANFIVGQTGLEKRKYVLETGFTCGTQERITIRVGDHMGQPYVLPEPIHLTREGTEFRLEQNVTNGCFTGTYTYLLTTPEFSPAAYLGLKQTLKDIEATWRKRPLFVATENKKPDSEVLDQCSDIVVLNPRHVVTTNRYTQRILTYAGKKSQSELKFVFNPAWQKVTLISATVSNVNGKVHQVTPKEQNVMDAPWSGTAPRYPASKMLVVNLPGVEVGSVISVCSVQEEQGDTFASGHVEFGGRERVLREQIRMIYPRDLEPLFQTFFADALRVTATTNASTIVASWSCQEPPFVRNEELLPPWHLYKPTLFYTFGAWRDHAHTLKQAIAAVADRDAKARRYARSLIRGVSDDEARMRIIRDAVLRTIRPVAVSYAELPLATLSTPDKTLTDQYGHALDRAMLLTSMLEEVGIDAQIVFASRDTSRFPAASQPFRDIPQTDYFDAPLVAATVNGWVYYLNEGDQYDEPGTTRLESAAYLTLSGKFKTIDLQPLHRDQSKKSWLIEVQTNGTAQITVTNWYFGSAVGPFRKNYREMLPEDRRRHFLELANSISKSATPRSELITETAAYPAYRTCSLEAENYAVVEGNTLTVLVPDMMAPIFGLRGDRRENPLFLRTTSEDTIECRIVLPRGYTRLQICPQDKTWTLPCGLGEFTCTVRSVLRADGRLEVVMARTYHARSGYAEAQLYPALLEYNRGIAHPSSRTLVVEK